MRWIMLALLLALVSATALAGEARYAVLALIGDRLLVVEREMATGSRLDRNTRTFIPIAGPAVDREALFYQARLRVRDGYIGAGFLEGVGFYLDPSTRLDDPETGEVSEGFVAPFAYFRLALIDLAAGRVVRDEVVRSSATVSRQGALTPWQSLDAGQKERMLGALIRGEIARVMPALLAR